MRGSLVDYLRAAEAYLNDILQQKKATDRAKKKDAWPHRK